MYTSTKKYSGIYFKSKYEKGELIKYIADKKNVEYSVFVDRGMDARVISEAWDLEFYHDVKMRIG